ncbi:MAG TPA: ABC transporter substrate-binding protein, partial [Bacillota bacterium]|nr:ABC transporter substrate-binding protein [Bacillota bacterium]
MKGIKKIAALVLALVMMATVVGCGGTKKAENQPAPTENKEKIFVFARGGDASGLDPINVTDGESLYVTQQIFDTLLEYEDDSTEVKPSLATEWENSKDGKEWTLKLKQGVKFHDGTPFNAEAVKFNFDRWRDEKNPYHKGDFAYYPTMFGGFPGIIKDVVVVDEYTVKFVLTTPQAPFLANLAMATFGISSPEAIKKYGDDYFKNPVGTGPFKFVKWEKDQQIVVAKNADYWGDKAKVDQIVFRVIPDNSARFLELKAGTIDAMVGLNPDDVESVKGDANLQLLLRPSMNVGYMALNMEKKPLDNQKVRQAINHAINKQALIDAFYAGLAKTAKNPLPPSLWGYNDKVKGYEYDPAKAKALLAEAGFPNGFEIKLWAMPVARPYMPQPKEIGQAIQQDLAKVGIKATIVTYDWSTYLQKGESGEPELYLIGWTGDNGDPDNFLYALLHKNNTVKGSA